MIQQVLYELGLKDKFTPGVLQADGAVRKLESSIGGVIAKGFALFAGFDFLRGAVQDFNAAEQASAQLNASLVSTGNIAGLNRKALDDQAAALMNTSLFDDDDITRAQSILATFTNIRGEVFMNTIPAVADLATKMGTDLKGAVIQVGKALQDTSGKGLTMLKKSGVDFSESQLKVIKSLFATGKVAEAQTMILAELRKEFDGSALAASKAGTGPFTVLQHQFQNVKEEIGQMAVALGIKLMPYLRAFVEHTKNAVRWVREHTTMVKNLTIALGSAWAAFKVIGGAAALFQSIGAASTVAVGGIQAVGAASTAALGPIGLLALAIGGVVFAWNQMVDMNKADMKKAIKETSAVLRESAIADENILLDIHKRRLMKYGVKPEAAEKKAIEIEFERLNKAMSEVQGKDSDEQQRIGEHLAALFDIRDKGIVAPKAVNKVVPPEFDKVLKKEKPLQTKATGAKSVTINVDIRELIGIKEFKTTNIKEGITRIKEAVVGVMTGAVNDFQIVAAGT